jgi:LysM repeat protein
VYQLQPSGPPQNTYNPPPPPPPPPAPTPAPVQTQTSGSTYTIQAGDTFWSISIEFGTTVAALEAANPSLDPNDLQIGEVISIP